MIVLGAVVALAGAAAAISAAHGLGVWLLLMIMHGALVDKAGESAVHLPMFAGVAVALTLVVRKQWIGLRPRTIGFFAALIVTMTTAALLGLDPASSTGNLLLYAKVFLMAVLLAGCLSSERDFRILSGYFVAAVLLGAALAVYQHLSGSYAVNSLYEKRVGGLRGDPNDTAMLLVGGVPFVWCYLVESKRWASRAMWGGAIGLIVYAIVLTGSRGGGVAFAAVALVMYVKRPTVSLSIGVAVILAACLLWAPKQSWERIATLVTWTDEHGGASLSNRSALQTGGLEIIVNRPILGVGAGNFASAFLLGGKATLMGAQSVGVAHNLHLEFFAENGLVGGLLLWGIFLLALRGLLAYDGDTSSSPRGVGLGFALAVSLGGMLLAGLFLSQGKNSVLWFLVGMGLGAAELVRRRGTSRRRRPRVVAAGVIAQRHLTGVPARVFAR